MSFTGKQAAEVLREYNRVAYSRMGETLRMSLADRGAPERVINLVIMMAGKIVTEMLPRIEAILVKLESEEVTFDEAVFAQLELAAEQASRMGEMVNEVVLAVMEGNPILRIVN